MCKDDTALAVCVHCLRGYGSALPCGASRYYESLHETPLIANTIARKKLFEMNRYTPDYMRFRGSFRAETLTFGTVARIYMRFRGSLRAMMPNNLHLERLLASTQLNRTRACLAAVSSRTPPSTAATCTARCAYPRGLSRPAIGSDCILPSWFLWCVWSGCPLPIVAPVLCGSAALSPLFFVVSPLFRRLSSWFRCSPSTKRFLQRGVSSPQACEPLLTDFMKTVDTDVIGTKYNASGYVKKTRNSPESW